MGPLGHIDLFYGDASDSYIVQGPWYGIGDLGPLGHIDLVYVDLSDSYVVLAPLPITPLLMGPMCRWVLRRNEQCAEVR